MAGRGEAFFFALFFLTGCSTETDPPTPIAKHDRVATLAPHLTELVFAAGAGHKLVGVSAYSDYPAAALELPLIGDAFAVDHERLIILEPDLLLAWQGGTPAHVVDELRRLGYNVEVIRISTLADVADALRRIGELTDSANKANDVALEYTEGLQSFERRYADAEDLRVFYQVDKRPLYTINQQHYTWMGLRRLYRWRQLWSVTLKPCSRAATQRMALSTNGIAGRTSPPTVTRTVF